MPKNVPWTRAQEAQFISMWREGVPTAEIAEHFGITGSSASQWSCRLRARGVDLPMRLPGGSAKDRARIMPYRRVEPVKSATDPLAVTDPGLLRARLAAVRLHGPEEAMLNAMRVRGLAK